MPTRWAVNVGFVYMLFLRSKCTFYFRKYVIRWSLSHRILSGFQPRGIVEVDRWSQLFDWASGGEET